MFEMLDSISLERVTNIVHFLMWIVVKEDNKVSVENISSDIGVANEKIARNILKDNGFYKMNEMELENFADRLYEYLEYREEQEYELDMKIGKSLIERMKKG